MSGGERRKLALAPQETVCVDRAAGRIIALDHCACPPAVPIATAGERTDEAAIACMKYYGIDRISVVK